MEKTSEALNSETLLEALRLEDVESRKGLFGLLCDFSLLPPAEINLTHYTLGTALFRNKARSGTEKKES